MKHLTSKGPALLSHTLGSPGERCSPQITLGNRCLQTMLESMMVPPDSRAREHQN